ncbi:MAG TPA: phenylalanine--tRNA ligase subunit alpha [Actinomycetota bacterium]|nr:phenylalanine--tRNA ligase subunit alpha [Actinomycetota bacterium]
MAVVTPPDEAIRTLEAELERGRSLAAGARTLEDLERAEAAVLGRRSPLAGIQRSLGSLPEEARRRVGQRTNEVREALRALFAERRAELEAEREAALLEAERVDVTLPGRRPRPGSLHPLTLVEYRIVDIFTRMGYRVVEGPEVETEWYNFQALNIPADHPARTEKDTLYVDVPGHPDLLLRTETSAMQIRTMERERPPVYVVSPGRVFRQDTPDPTHSPVFHQVEGLAVDEGISLADLKGTLEAFARAMFGPETAVRFTPDYFPFVEPGAEMAVSCFACGGGGCRVCKFQGWIELLGAGMVHPNVLANVGYDPERYTGFAFGMGVERIAMALYGVPDIRMFFDNDVRFLEQFQAAG